jgi:hypothetical protein
MFGGGFPGSEEERFSPKGYQLCASVGRIMRNYSESAGNAEHTDFWTVKVAKQFYAIEPNICKSLIMSMHRVGIEPNPVINFTQRGSPVWLTMGL